jgi:hypothetical protein
VPYNFVVYFIELCLILLVGLYFRNRLTTPFILLTVLIFVTIVSESLSHIAAHQIKNNSTIFHLYAPIEFTIKSAIYYLLFRHTIIKKIVFIVVFLFAAFVIYNAAYLQAIDQAPFNNNTVACIVFITYAFLMYWEMINLEIETSLFAHPTFWFNSGMLIYYSSSLIFWGIYHIIQDNANFKILNFAMWLLNLIFYLFLGISIYYAGKKAPN